MLSPSITPTTQIPTTKVSKQASSSWPRPSKALKTEVTIQAPSFASAKEQQLSRFVTEQPPSKNQFPSLAPLSTIAELPKQEPPGSLSETKPPASIEASQEVMVIAQQDPNQVAKPETSHSMEKHENPNVGVNETSRSLENGKAASIPLPSSPVSDDHVDSTDLSRSTAPTDDSGSHQEPSQPLSESKAKAAEEIDHPDGEERATWASRLSSILPQAMLEQPTEPDTDVANTRPSRMSSVAPGAYPDSDSMEETLKPTPDSDVEEPQAESRSPQTIPPGKSTRSRKSVSIVLPDAYNDSGNAEQTKTDRSPTTADNRMKPSGSSLEMLNSGTEARENTQDDVVAPKERSRQASQAEQYVKDEVHGSNESQGGNESEKSKISTPQLDPELFLKPDKAGNPHHGSPVSPASSIAALQEGTDKTDWLTLHERESLAPSDADNSSLNPLLSSSPRYALSSHFSESLGETRSEFIPAGREKTTAPNHETEGDSPPMLDDLSEISTVVSSTSSEAKTGTKGEPRYPFPSIGNGEGPSRTEPLQEAPKIVIKDASEVESSRQSPPLRAPATTPTQGSSPHRQAAFIALGEPSNQGPVKLPMKRRRLYLRKARYHVLRQPLLNAALGRQVGAQAKSALKKLANGELIIIEPPASL